MTGEILASWFGSAAAAAVVSWIVAVGTLKTKTAVLEERVDNHYRELSGKVDQVLSELRDARHLAREHHQ